MSTQLDTNKPLTVQIVDWYSDNYDKRENNSNYNSDSLDWTRDYENDSDDDEEEEEEELEEEYNDYGYSDEEIEDGYREKNKKNNYGDNSNYKIFIFAKDIEENTYCIEVNEFTPYFYIRIPDYCTKYHVGLIEEWVKDHIFPKFKDSVLRATLLERHSFRNFDNKKLYKFVRLVFKNTKGMQAAISLFQNKDVDTKTSQIKKTPKKIHISGVTNQPYTYDLYENMIDPLLKFIHHKDIKPVGWIKLPANKYIEGNTNSRCNYNISVRWTDIKAIENTDNTKIKVMAYDIECDSSHGDFPIPIKDYTKLGREIFSRYMKLDGIVNKAKANKKDTTIDWLSIKDRLENRIGFAKEMIGYSFRKNGNTDEDISPVFTKDCLNVRAETIDMVAKKIAPYLVLSVLPNTNDRKRENTKNTNRIITLLNQNLPPLEGDKTIQIGMSFMKYGETIPYRNVMLTVGTCDKLSNAETIAFKNETELLLKFREILLEEDPEIITGYNIDGFDTTWLFKRAQELEIYEDFADIGRFRGLISQLKEKQVKSPVGELIKKEYVDIAGRIQLDILPQVQKGYQLESYKLDDVSTHFINGSIKDLVYDPSTGETVITTDSVKNLNENNYIMFSYSDEHETNRYNDGEKFEVYRLERDAISKFNEKKGKIEKLSTFRVKSKLDLDIKKYRCSWALGKDDVSPNDIFRLQKGSSADRYIIAKYCMMDVILCLELLLKLELITNSIGMANVCLNPLSWIIHRGQGVKILSLVAYFIKQKNYLLPFLYKDSFDRDGYEGAVVLDPNPKIYLDDEPISVLDYGSLYPSSMREKNISHETIVTNEKFLGEEGAKLLDQMGYDIEDVQYDIFKTIFNSNGNKKDKIKIGVKTVRYVQYRDGTKGIIPQILEYLVNARKTTRNKITYRSITTKSGQSYIGNLIEKDGSVKIKTDKETIDITNDPVVTNEETYNKFQQNVLDGLQLAFKVTANSLYGQVGAKTSDIYYKELAASTTSVGRNCLMIAKEYVENPQNYPHKLKNGNTMYLTNKVVYGDSCTGDTPIILKVDNKIVITTFDDFNSDNWETYNNFKPYETNLSEKQMINTVDRDIKIWTHKGWSKVRKIIRHKTDKKIYRVLTHTGCVDVTEDHSLLDPNVNQIKPKDCKIGMELLHSYPEIDTLQASDIDYIYKHNLDYGNGLFQSNNKKEIQEVWLELVYRGCRNFNLDEIDGLYILYWGTNISSKNTIKQIEMLYEKYLDYVFDIETEEGVFHAGIGSMIIKNTDSVFVKFQCVDDEGNPLKGRDARIVSIKLGMYTDAEIQRTKLKEPQVLEYEKTFHPFILFTKKRYVGNLYEHDPDSFKRKSMGIVLKRRDNAPIVKIIYAGILDIIMKQNDIRASATFLRKTLRELIDGKFGLDKLVITKTLSSYYKDPEKIAHRVLADRIAERDPGNKPQVNERIPFIYFDTSKIKTDRKLLQGEKIETPDYIKSNKLLPDYETYINNQIKKPVTQIFALCLDQIPNFKGDLSEYDKMFKSLISSGVNRNTAIKKVLEAKRKVAEQLLFGDILRVLENKRKGNNDISQFFRK